MLVVEGPGNGPWDRLHHLSFLCGSVAAGLGLAFATYHLSARWGGSGSIIP